MRRTASSIVFGDARPSEASVANAAASRKAEPKSARPRSSLGCGEMAGVELGFDGKFAAPDPGPALVRQTLGLIAAQIALKVIAKKGLDKIAVANPVNR